MKGSDNIYSLFLTFEEISLVHMAGNRTRKETADYLSYCHENNLCIDPSGNLSESCRSAAEKIRAISDDDFKMLKNEYSDMWI